MNIYHFPSLESTHTTALQILSEQKIEDAFAVHTDQQLQGVGTLGRAWHMTKGNMAVTYCLPIPLNIDFSGVSLAIAVCVHQVLLNHSPDSDVPLPLMIKWANDLYLADGKFGGILIHDDTISLQRWLRIGIGLNLVQTDILESDYPIACLQQYWHGCPQASDLIHPLGEALSKMLVVFQEKGFDVFRHYFLNHALYFNQKVQVKTPRETIIGVFADINSKGHIGLLQENQTWIYAISGTLRQF